MILNRLEILNFKNIAMASCSFAPKMNCFFGANGMGKTNLLDAIHYLSVVRSHIGTTDSDVVLSGTNETILQGKYTRCSNSEEEETLVLKISKEKNKSLSRNGKLYQRLSSHIGRYPLVIVSPQDHKLIRGGSDERRRFFDKLLSQNNPNYLDALIEYSRALAQRNTLLRNSNRDSILFDYVEHVLAKRGVEIVKYRTELTDRFTSTFDQMYSFLSQDAEKVSLCYKSAVPLDENSLKHQLEVSRKSDYEVGYTTLGIHKDDWEMLIGERLMRKIGSEGQNKTYLIALKMAEYTHTLEQVTPIRPTLLLDDLFDKLDAERVERIMTLVAQENFGQIFITDTNRKYLDEIIRAQGTDFALFQLSHGEAIQL